MPLLNPNRATFPVVDNEPSLIKVTSNFTEGDIGAVVAFAATGVVFGWRTGGGNSNSNSKFNSDFLTGIIWFSGDCKNQIPFFSSSLFFLSVDRQEGLGIFLLWKSGNVRRIPFFIPEQCWYLKLILFHNRKNPDWSFSNSFPSFLWGFTARLMGLRENAYEVSKYGVPEKWVRPPVC